MGRQLVEMTGAVVPIHTKLLCAATDIRDTEKEPMTRAVEIARGKRELAHLPANPILM